MVVGMLISNRAIIHFFLDNFISTLPVEKYKLPISVSFFSVQSMCNLFSGKNLMIHACTIVHTFKLIELERYHTSYLNVYYCDAYINIKLYLPPVPRFSIYPALLRIIEIPYIHYQ